ncbi:UNVERIFIED_CONTAM: Ureide permease 2 [Sesamum radiatum]|uniref:Ureide permease 2 n=1 Tax=Sesamum radiatum TaxID=300843 RepID=A0AAW2JQI3_SESRA
MYVVESKGGAIACMLLSLLLLGTWPAILTLLERRGRLPQHTYLDYTITNLLAALIIAFTFGEIGTSSIDKPNFINQLAQDNWPSVLFAMTGGIALSLGNLATQYAWAFVGLSVTEVITSSITVVIGTRKREKGRRWQRAREGGAATGEMGGRGRCGWELGKGVWTERGGEGGTVTGEMGGGGRRSEGSGRGGSLGAATTQLVWGSGATGHGVAARATSVGMRTATGMEVEAVD